MSDYETLVQFNKKSVSNDMVRFLVTLTSSIVKVKNDSSSYHDYNNGIPSLYQFIKQIIFNSKVQTPTLMATSVYLTRLGNIIQSESVYGIDTTSHRIFLGCLILSAKTLNDASPLNKHWANYTNGLLNINEINIIERELLSYFNWNINIDSIELIDVLSPLLTDFKNNSNAYNQYHNNYDYLLFNSPMSPNGNLHPKDFQKQLLLHSRSISNMSIPSIVSASSSSSSTFSSSSSASSIIEQNVDIGLNSKSININPYNIPLTSKKIKLNINTNNSINSSNKKRQYLKSNNLIKLKKKSNWSSLFKV